MFAIHNSHSCHYDHYFTYLKSGCSVTPLLHIYVFSSVKDSFLEIVVSYLHYFMSTLFT